jgi:hypothetical protein
MESNTHTRFVADVDMQGTNIRIRSPFQLHRSEQRQFVRLEISSPMSLRKIKDIAGGFWPGGDSYPIDGTILNISAGGVLVEIDEPLSEGDLVAMRFTLREGETLNNVLGVVKRVEADDGTFLVGAEFVDRTHLRDKLTHGELELLSEQPADFTQSVRDVLEKYIYREPGGHE